MSTITNEQRSADEVAAFMSDTPGPYFAYWSAGDRITTWTGDELATITWTGDPFYSSFGDRRRNFRAKGINGVTYSGTAYLTAGDYVRMRPVKS